MIKKPKIAIGVASTEGDTFVSISNEIVPLDLILSIAKKYGIPVIWDENIATQLTQFELDENLPPELVEALEKTIKTLKKD